MQPAVLKALEFDRIREALARDALTPLGRVRLDALVPATDPAEVRRGLDLTTEAVRRTKAGGSMAIDAAEDLVTVLGTLEIGDQSLEPLGLLSLARFVTSVDQVATSIGPDTPLLHEIAARSASFAREAQAIHR